MKFTKEQALEQLKSELTKGGKTLHLSDRTINGHIDDLLPLLVNDETELTDFINKAFPFVKRVDANFEKEKADFIKNYKPAEPTTPPAVDPAKKDESGNPMDSVLAEMQKRLDAVTQTLEAERKGKVLQEIKGRLKSTMKEKGIKEDKWTEKYLSEIEVSENMDVEAKAKAALEIYNLSHAQNTPSITPQVPTNGSGDKKIDWKNYLNE